MTLVLFTDFGLTTVVFILFVALEIRGKVFDSIFTL